MHRKSIDYFKRDRVKLEVFYVASVSRLDFPFIHYETTYYCFSTVSGEREVTGNFRGAVHQSAACEAFYAKQAHIKDADVRAVRFAQ